MTEELFCLKFELDALSEVTLKNESERWIPGFIHAITEKDHVDRYKLACDHSKGKKVLDIACGVGKGSYMMRTEGEATFVMGCDLSPSAIRYANHRNAHPQIVFQIQDAGQFLNDEEFDLVISFETIEHLKDPARFLENAKKNLRTGGQLIISTPIASVPLNTSPSNPYHVQEWGFQEFQKLLANYFTIDEIYIQLYQNAVVNEKLKAEFDKKAIQSSGIIKRLCDRLLSRPLPQPGRPAYVNDWNSHLNKSKLVKYTGQYLAEKLGSVYPGYQVIVCNKDNG